MKRINWKYLTGVGIFISIFCVGSVTVDALPTSFDGRTSNNGYLSNGYGNYHDWVFVPLPADEHVGLTLPDASQGDCNVSCNVTLQSFITVFQDRLNDGGTKPTGLAAVDQGRAAGEIDMMLGQSGPSFGSGQAGINAGIAYAKANFATWVSIVTLYASGTVPGYSVDFNSYDFFPGSPGDPGWNGMGMTTINQTSDITDCTFGQGCIGDISVYQGFTASDFDYAVDFKAPGGRNFFIKHKCANLTSDTTPFVIPPSTPPTTLSCGGLNAPAELDPKTQFNVTATVKYSPSSGATTTGSTQNMFITVLGSKHIITPTLSNMTGTAIGTLANAGPTNGTGTFTVSYGVQDKTTGAVALTCTDTLTVANLPYFSVAGGDVSAGQGFGSSCTGNPAADITGENLDSGNGSPNYFGAGTRQAAIATGKISQFATDTTNAISSNLGGSSDGLSTHQPSGLAFANTAASGTTYGGQFMQGSSASWCVPDYAASAAASSGSFNPASLKSGTYQLTGSTLPSMTIPAGVHVTVVATGDVYISGNITYGNYTSLADIPQFTLLVKGGNIYVGSTVQELHGFYDAQPAASGTAGAGLLYTCATASGTPATDYATCNQPLTFYGAVAAGQLIPGRTFGNVAPAGTTSDHPAEQFVFTPELWLGSMFGPTIGCATDPTQSQCLYQSYTSLPPVL